MLVVQKIEHLSMDSDYVIEWELISSSCELVHHSDIKTVDQSKSQTKTLLVICVTFYAAVWSFCHKTVEGQKNEKLIIWR